MIRSIIMSANDVHIGTIYKEKNGYRISWKERTKNKSGNQHTSGKDLYPTLKEARQGVFRKLRSAKIIEKK